MDNLFNSAVATAVAEVCTLPICTVKTNYQNGNFSSIRQTVTSIYRSNGVYGFFKASVPAVGGQILSTSSKFFLYRSLQDRFNPEYNPWIRFINGATSGILSSVATHPIDSVRVHWQMNANVPWRENPLVFYRGYSKTLAKVTVSSTLFFPTYDWLHKDRGWSSVAASLTTAFFCTTVLQPLDFAKTRQIYGLERPHFNLAPGFFRVLRNYYRGVLLNYARIVPHFTIVMFVIHKLETM